MQVLFNIIDLVWVGYGIKEDICTVNEDLKVAVDFFKVSAFVNLSLYVNPRKKMSMKFHLFLHVPFYF